MAMFAALALGAPAGSTLYAKGGLGAVAAGTALIPLGSLALVLPLKAAPPRGGERSSIRQVLSSVWMPGLGAALSSVGFGAILAFGSLLAVQRGWMPVWLVFTAFAIALVLGRLLLGHLPDRLGGARVALICVFIEAGGLACIWLARGPVTAGIGAAMTGFGYALVYPGLGIEAVNRAPPQSRGLAMGAYTVCLDAALGLGTPLLGLVAGWTNLGAVFLAGTIAVLGAALVTFGIYHRARTTERTP